MGEILSWLSQHNSIELNEDKLISIKTLVLCCSNSMNWSGKGLLCYWTVVYHPCHCPNNITGLHSHPANKMP